ncbi:MAG: hypothetical protein WBP13_04035 [Methylophilaceae bacterium]
MQKTQMPAYTLSESQRELSEKHSFTYLTTFIKAFLPHGLSSTLINLLIGGTNKGLELVKSMHLKNAFINLLNLSLGIRQQNMDDNHIQAYLNSVGNQYNCPFTERPMAYDVAKKTIYCEEIEMKNKAEVRL